jgi:hypothetical protein
VPPSTLYKYTTDTTAQLILSNGRLRWSSPGLFNDLAEFQRMPRFSPTVTEAHGLLPRVLIDAVLGKGRLDYARLAPQIKMLLTMIEMLIKSGQPEAKICEMLAQQAPDADEKIEKALREHFESLDPNQARVLCLTSKFDNEVMWGTYAGNHSGIVFGFTHIPELSTPLTEARQVSYSEQPQVVGSGLDFLLYGDSPELRARTLEAVCYSKTSAWSYEQEWRALTWRPEESDRAFGDYLFYPNELESVTFGVRSSADYVEHITSIMREKYPEAARYKMESIYGELRRVSLPRLPYATGA